jgi:DNA-binding MarR family transcriptional regulator
MKLEEAIKSTKFKNEVQKAGINILYTAWWFKTTACTILKEFGLTHEQYNVLRILKGKHPNEMCVKDIACRMIEKNSNVPRIIDRLEEKKFVTRTQGSTDARQTVIQLTQIGIEILASSTIKMTQMLGDTITLSNEEAVTLNNLLEKVRQKEI